MSVIKWALLNIHARAHSTLNSLKLFMLVEQSKITHATQARQRKTRPRACQRPDGTPDERPELLRGLHSPIGQLLGGLLYDSEFEF